MKCPRCHTEVPNEATHCPDCKLPKPKGLCVQEEKTEQKAAAAKSASARANRNKRTPMKKRPKWVTSIAGSAAFLLLCGMGFYVFSFFAHKPPEVDPQAALPMLDKLRRSPSTQEGLNVDALLAQELEKSRRVGNLLSYQGWTIKPVNGSKTKLIFSFSFEESDNTQQRAEWVADLVNNTFTPQTELAVAVSRR